MAKKTAGQRMREVKFTAFDSERKLIEDAARKTGQKRASYIRETMVRRARFDLTGEGSIPWESSELASIDKEVLAEAIRLVRLMKTKG